MRLSELRGLDPVNQSAADAVASLPVFDDLRRATIAAQPVEDVGRDLNVWLRDHSRARRPLVLSTLAAAVGIFVLLTFPAGGGQAKDRLAAYSKQASASRARLWPRSAYQRRSLCRPRSRRLLRPQLRTTA